MFPCPVRFAILVIGFILRVTAFSLPVLTERPHPTRLFLKNRAPRQASLLGWKNRGPRQASLLGWKNRGPRQASLLGWKNRGPWQASLLGWKKSRTSPHSPVQSRSENALRWRWTGALNGDRRWRAALRARRPS